MRRITLLIALLVSLFGAAQQTVHLKPEIFIGIQEIQLA